jgi:hypothetical protein
MELKYPSPKPPPKTLSKTALLPPATSLHLKDGGWSAQDKEQDKESTHCCPHTKLGCARMDALKVTTQISISNLIQVLHLYINTQPIIN